MGNEVRRQLEKQIPGNCTMPGAPVQKIKMAFLVGASFIGTSRCLVLDWREREVKQADVIGFKGTIGV